MLRTSEINAIASAVAKKLDNRDRLLTVEQLAAMMGKSTGAIKKMCQREQLPFHLFHKTYYFNESEINNVLLKS